MQVIKERIITKRDKEGRRETCEEQLRRMCKNIAEDISAGNPEGKDSKTASAWMEDVYDIRYLIDRDKEYMGAELMVAGGGPVIWVDTWRDQVKGWWGCDKVLIPYADNLGLNDYCEEMYSCS